MFFFFLYKNTSLIFLSAFFFLCDFWDLSVCLFLWWTGARLVMLSEFLVVFPLLLPHAHKKCNLGAIISGSWLLWIPLHSWHVLMLMIFPNIPLLLQLNATCDIWYLSSWKWLWWWDLMLCLDETLMCNTQEPPQGVQNPFPAI